jgi:15-cis-phytoene synthase
MLPPASQACIRTAFAVYGAILDEIEAAGRDVFVRRAMVPRRRRLGLLARSLATRPAAPAALAPSHRQGAADEAVLRVRGITVERFQ